MRPKYGDLTPDARADSFKVGDLIGMTGSGHMRGVITVSEPRGSGWHLEWEVIEDCDHSQWTGPPYVQDSRMALLVPDLIIEEEPA